MNIARSGDDGDRSSAIVEGGHFSRRLARRLCRKGCKQPSSDLPSLPPRPLIGNPNRWRRLIPSGCVTTRSNVPLLFPLPILCLRDLATIPSPISPVQRVKSIQVATVLTIGRPESKRERSSCCGRVQGTRTWRVSWSAHGRVVAHLESLGGPTVQLARHWRHTHLVEGLIFALRAKPNSKWC